MINQHAKHSPSSLGNKANCPGWTSNNRGDKSAAIAGTECHAWMEWHMSQKGPEPPLTAPQRAFCAISLESVRKITNALTAQIKLKPVFYIEQKVVIKQGKREVTFGTVDLIASYGKVLLIIDYKFGALPVPEPRENWQAQAYVAGAFQMFPGATEVQFHFVHPQLKLHTTGTFLRAEEPALTKKVDNLITICESPDKILKPSDLNCQWCGSRVECPALGKQALAVVEGVQGSCEGVFDLPAEFNPQNITDPVEMDKALAARAMLSKWCDDVKDCALEMNRAGTKFTNFELRSRRGKKEITKIKETFDTLQTLCNIELPDFLATCKVDPKLLETMIKAQFPTGQKASNTASIMEELDDIGLLERRPGSQFLCRKRS